jgi:hypothetical protein
MGLRSSDARSGPNGVDWSVQVGSHAAAAAAVAGKVN